MNEDNTGDERTIFVVEDDEGLSSLIKKNLRRAGFQTDSASCGAEAISKINGDQKILLLLDYGLPDMKGSQIIEKLIENNHLVPFVVMTGQGDERVAVEMMKLGARDYVVKDARFMDLLPQVVNRVMEQLAIERKLEETEAKLHEKEQSISALMGNLPGMAYRSQNDRDRTVLFVSEGSIDLSGKKPDDLKGTAYMKLTHPNDQAIVLDEIQSALKEKRQFQLTYRINSSGGEEKWVLEKGSGVFSKEGELLALESFVMDITDRKQAEVEREILLKKLENLIEESPVATISTDPDGKIITINKSAKNLIKIEEYGGGSISSILGQEIKLEGKDDFVLNFKRKDGAEIPLTVSTAILEEGGEKKGLIVTLKDISELKGLIIKPVKEEEVIKEDLKLSLETGTCYILDYDDFSKGYEIFIDYVKHRKHGLCITRQSPPKVRRKYTLEKTPIIWLSKAETSEEKCISPDDLSKLDSTIKNFIKEADDGIVLFEGIEYLNIHNNFGSVIKFINSLTDALALSSSSLLVLVDSKVFDDKEFHVLKRDLESFEVGGYKIFEPTSKEGLQVSAIGGEGTHEGG